jgi:hypothetical protein
MTQKLLQEQINKKVDNQSNNFGFFLDVFSHLNNYLIFYHLKNGFLKLIKVISKIHSVILFEI